MRRLTCVRCHTVRDETAFYVQSSKPRGRSYACKECLGPQYRRSARAWSAAHPEQRHAQNLKKYNLTPDDYALILAHQGGVCAICGMAPAGRKKRLEIDHNHSTGHIRGALCTRCNVLLGMAQDDERVLRAAIEYLMCGQTYQTLAQQEVIDYDSLKAGGGSHR